jgi:hypothetical protein
MQMCLAEAELFSADGRTDRQTNRQTDRPTDKQTDMAKLIFTFRNRANARKNGLKISQTLQGYYKFFLKLFKSTGLIP